MLFNSSTSDFEPDCPVATPTRIFVQGVVRALWDVSAPRQKTILHDLALQIDCAPSELYFLIEDAKSVAEADIGQPDFHERLSA